MKTIKKIYSVREFDELSEEEKREAVEKYQFINVEDNWFSFYLDEFRQELEGVGVTGGEIYFNLGRSSYFYMSRMSVDTSKFLKVFIEEYNKGEKDKKYKLSYDFLNSLFEEGLIDLYVGYERNSFYFEITDYEGKLELYEREKAVDLQEGLREFLQENYFNKFLKKLREAYDYLTSDEAVIESIKANDITFEELQEVEGVESN